MSEAKIQAECVAWFKNEYVGSLIDGYLLKAENAKYMRMLLHGNQNETGGMHFKQVSKLKAMGLTAGVADISLKCMFEFKGKVYPYAEIEFKTPAKASKQSDIQKVYQEAVTFAGGLYIIIRSVEEFKEFIESIIFVIP